MENAKQSAVKSMSIVNFILGAWLIVSPYIFGYATGQARWNQTVMGIIIVVLAIWRYTAVDAAWASWVNALVSLWLIIAPFALGYQLAAAYWNEIIVAIITLVVAGTNANMHVHRPHTAAL
jgi:hypothetical protein